MNQVTERAEVTRWLAGYEAAWRAPGTGDLAGLFTSDAAYLQSPYEQPVTGLDAIKRMWEEEREGPVEVFTLATDILAVDGPTAVGRAEDPMETRLARSTAICGSSGSPVTAAAPGSRSGPTGQSASSSRVGVAGFHLS
jgi:ketosteroid isomerase-like protein